MKEIKQQLTSLLIKFNENKLDKKLGHINTSIKEDIITLKKKVKTTQYLHTYYKILLKGKLDHFQCHVNNQLRNQQMKSKDFPIKIKHKNVIKFKSQNDLHDPKRFESTHIFNSND